jgi:hypothetical protein
LDTDNKQKVKEGTSKQNDKADDEEEDDEADIVSDLIFCTGTSFHSTINR